MKFAFKKGYLLPFIMAVSLFSIVAWKAACASFTHDEGFTGNIVIQESLIDTLVSRVPILTLHFLNTVLMKMSSLVFGTSELALRLPNVLAFAIYLASALCVIRSLPPVGRLPTFIFLTCHLYLVDFFALARGYGLSLAFVLASLCCWFREGSERSFLSRHWYILFGGLAALSNLTCLYFFVALIVVRNAVMLLDRQGHDVNSGQRGRSLARSLIAENMVPLLISLFLSALLVYPLHKINEAGQLYFGGTSGFWNETVRSVVNCLFYQIKYGSMMMTIIMIFVGMTSALSLAIVGWILLKRDVVLQQAHRPLVLSCLMLLTIVLGLSVHHYFFGAKIIIERSALFLVPIFFLQIIYLVHFLAQTEFKAVTVGAAYVLAGLLVVHGLRAMNVSYFPDWKYDKHTKEVLARVEREITPEQRKRGVRLGIEWLFEPTINFYRRTRNISWLNEVDRNGVKGTEDFFYVLTDHVENIEQFQPKVIVRYTDNNACLIRNP